MNGYTEEGFEEWAENELAKSPSWVEIMMMEDELGIPRLTLRATEIDKAWAYFHELKARLEQQQRRTA